MVKRKIQIYHYLDIFVEFCVNHANGSKVQVDKLISYMFVRTVTHIQLLSFVALCVKISVRNMIL